MTWFKHCSTLGLVLLLLMALCLPIKAVQAISVKIDGTLVPYSAFYGYPFADKANRTQVPFRLTLETFGCTVSWDPISNTAIAKKGETSVQVPIGKPYLLNNGEKIPMDTAAIVQNNRTYLPIRAVLESFGAQVDWDGAHQCVCISSVSPAPVQVHFIDVGQGDATLIDCGTTEVLIDGGDNAAGPKVVSYLSRYVNGPLELIIATHPHADHIGGLDNVLAAFPVNAVIDSGCAADSDTYRDYRNAVKQEPNCTFSYDETQILNLNPQVDLSIIEPGDQWDNPNDSSIVAQLICGDVSVLFTGDLSQTVEQQCLPLLGDIDVLKVGHHGSATSSCSEFLSVVRPEVAVISYGVGNRYHHPTAAALNRLFSCGAVVYGTGKSGTLVLTTNGQTYQFSPAVPLTPSDAGR